MGKINLVQFSQTFKQRSDFSDDGVSWPAAAEPLMGMRVFFWPLSEQVGGEGKWFFPSPFTYKKMEAMKNKVSCNVPLKRNKWNAAPCSQKMQALKQALGRHSLPTAAGTKYSPTHLVLLLPWRPLTFCIPWLGAWDWLGHLWVFMFSLGFWTREGEEREGF